MSWHFSQAAVEEFSAVTCSDGTQSAQSKSSHTQLAYCSPDRMTEFSRLSRFGMTFLPLTADRGEELLTSYLAGFRVRTSALPEKAPESQESAADCGQKWRGSLAKFDRNSSSWKTVQLSLLVDSEQSSVIWPRSGMTAGGQCWELPTLVRRTREIGSGLWVPTPICNDAENRGNFNPERSWGLAGFAKTWPTPNTKGLDGGSNSRKAAKARGMWPTATACMGKGSSVASLTRKDGRSGVGDRLDHAVMAQDGGSLNPTWVEWLMGWPLDWSVLKPLETDKYRQWQQQHGGC